MSSHRFLDCLTHEQDIMSREVAEIRAQQLLDERKKQLEEEISTAPGLGDRVVPATNSQQEDQKS